MEKEIEGEGEGEGHEEFLSPPSSLSLTVPPALSGAAPPSPSSSAEAPFAVGSVRPLQIIDRDDYNVLFQDCQSSALSHATTRGVKVRPSKEASSV